MSSKKSNKWDKGPASKIRDQEEDIIVSNKNVKDLSEKGSGKYSKLKVEMKNVTISENAKSLILKTLKFLYGEEFKAKDKSAYQDKGTNLSGQYWVNRGHLVIKESVDYSQRRRILKPHEKINMFAQEKLEKYGFHSNHCKEALMVTSGDVGAAYEFLMSRYMSLDLCDPDLEVSQSFLDERMQELNSLRSIYENCCDEQIANQLWIIHLDLPYLSDLYCDRRSEPQQEDNKVTSDIKRSKELCKFFVKGYCKFGIMCRFSHHVPEKKPIKYSDEDLNLRTKFELEIRFPKGCLYPIQEPLVSLYPLQCPMPSAARLRLTAHLQSMCKNYAKDETPCVFSLIDFLQNCSDEVLSVVQQRGPASCLLNPDIPLIPDNLVDSDDDNVASGQSPDSADKQVVKPSEEKSFMREDDELCRMFINKQSSGKYKEFLRNRQNLPAWGKMEDVLEAVENNQVIVISGETGCGKSTQVPQFILDNWLQSRVKGGSHVEIICTQPRRLSAIGVAQRVAEERTDRIGSVVGYQIRLESCVSSMTRLLFCTTGILLRRLESDPMLSSVTHIVIDEVHERSEESDFLLALLKELLPVRPDLKVILMSATLNAELFCQYFNDAPVVYIPGYTYPVQQFFLEDILQETNYVLEEDSIYAKRSSNKLSENSSTELEIADIKTFEFIPNPKTLDSNLTAVQLFHRYIKYSSNTSKTLYKMDPNKINFDLIECVLVWIVNGSHNFPRKGSILVFLPGMAEISTLHEQLSAHPIFNPKMGNFKLVPLHSSLSSEEQAEVFKKPKAGVRKIVLSTNICETSITIDDCVFVIDSGKMKENRFDSNRNMSSLEITWVSRANALQRKGRAGRVMPGVCIHLFTKHQYDYQFLSQPVPEIQRVPLEQIVLRIKTLPCLQGKSLESVLGSIIEPPKEENTISALKRLIDVGALDKEYQLTSLGCHLAALPVDVRIGKLMLFGAIFSCLDSALTIAACLSHKTPFIHPFNNKEQAYAKKKEFATGDSDQLTVLKAYSCWLKAYNESRHSGYVFANENFLSQSTLTVLSDMKSQLLDLLIDIGFVPESAKLRKKKSGVDIVLESTGPEINANNDNHRLLVSILCAALYPNIAQVLTPDKLYAQTAGGAIPKAHKPEEIKFKTRDTYANLHPSSVLYNCNEFSSPYLVYQELIKTSRVFIRECSVLPILPLILFAGSGMSVELHKSTFVISLEGGWIMFSVSHNQTGELIQAIRAELLKLLDEKIKDPSMNLLANPKGKKIISTIIYLVTHG